METHVLLPRLHVWPDRQTDRVRPTHRDTATEIERQGKRQAERQRNVETDTKPETDMKTKAATEEDTQRLRYRAAFKQIETTEQRSVQAKHLPRVVLCTPVVNG